MKDYQSYRDLKRDEQITNIQEEKRAKNFNLSSYRLLLFFSLLIVISAQVLIMTTQMARSKQFQLQELEKKHQTLEVERGRLLLERGALTSPARIEKIAREKLKMHFPKSEEIEVLTE